MSSVFLSVSSFELLVDFRSPELYFAGLAHKSPHRKPEKVHSVCVNINIITLKNILMFILCFIPQSRILYPLISDLSDFVFLFHIFFSHH